MIQNAQASVYCVGMFLLPACSTHVPCVGVLCRQHLYKREYERATCQSLLDDTIFKYENRSRIVAPVLVKQYET